MKVLVTGGAGYIGSTVCSALLDSGHIPIILDSLITGRIEFTKERIFYEGDIADSTLLEKIFSENPDIKCVIHCAALIVVPDSVQRPDEYYYENVVKSVILFKNLIKLGCKQVVFSSSAAIYDDVPNFMVDENSPLNPRSPYARTKYMMEMVLKDFCLAYGMKGISLRYFNPIGADPKMRTGAYIKNPSHVLGKLIQATNSDEDIFCITGTNWSTRDGTGIRDYIHVWDLANAHVKAVENFNSLFESANGSNKSYEVINLGNGKGVTVKEMVTAFERVIGREIAKKEVEPRPGDIAGAYANTDKANKLLNWSTQFSVEQGINDALVWLKRWSEIINAQEKK